jgi:hypothetical protein
MGEIMAAAMFCTAACAVSWLVGYIMGRQHEQDQWVGKKRA